MPNSFCHCKRCRKAKRKGLILGTRRATFWLVGYSGRVELYDGPVSDYVPYHRFSKGRRPVAKFDPRSIDQ
jgi:hypothetical protein